MTDIKPLFIVGIDPDLHKSGVSIWDVLNKAWLLHKAVPNEDVTELLTLHCTPENSIVYLEAGWLNKKSNFRGGNYGVAQAKARNVGENAGAGKMLVKMIEKSGYVVKLIKPLSKGKGLLKSKQGAWTEIGRKLIEDRTGIVSRINDDVRDSLFIVLAYR